MKSNKKMSRSINNESELLSHIDKNTRENLYKLFEEVKNEDEFELIFFGKKGSFLQQEKYIKLLKYLSKYAEISKLNFLEPCDILDINYSLDKNTSIRCTITKRENINKIMKKLNVPKNHVVFKTLVELYFNSKVKPDGMSFMKKEKENNYVVDVEDFDFRARLSHEVELTKDDIKHCLELDEKHMNKINFRYKQRTSLFVTGDEKSENFIRVDLTMAKNTDQFKKINKVVPNYELEIEYGTKTKSKKEFLDTMLKEAEKLLKVISESNYIMPKTKMVEVYNYYRNLLFISSDNVTGLDARQPITLEIQHVTEVLPNRYAVTEKADGDRQFLIIFEKRVYFLSTNMEIRYTGIELKNNDYDGSLLDGELIFIPKKNRHIYLAFDCLFHKSQDVRKTIKLFDRLKFADDIVKNCFVFQKQIGFESKPVLVDKKFDLNKQLEFHFEEIKRSIKNLNNDIELEKQYPLIRRKYFIGAEGAKDWEIFAYASLMYNAFTTNSSVNCPYYLDGLIFQPLDQSYVTNVNESRYSDFKWKPPEKNSIDFYVEFEKDKDGKVITAYDNSYDDEQGEFVKNKPYKICKLFVGQRNKGTEVPVLFREDEELYYAYIFIKDGEARDVEGNILSDKTVVEFYYNNNQETLDKFRWVPLRTRHDKTESVMRFGRRYGNAAVVANKIWRSILNPVLMSDIEDLATGNNPEKNIYTYDKKVSFLKSKITHELIMTATSENKYFQKITDLAKPMRGFVNWIKSNIIYTYCHPMYQDNRQLSVLDIGCGKGQDIMKFYYSMVSILVAIDVDREGLVSGTDGAVSRYNLLRTKKPNFPKMYFIQADATAKFDVELQHKALNVKKLENEDFFNKFFSKDSRMLFDRINCQLAVHYMLRNSDCWENFKNNLNNHLRNGGYFLASTFDAEKVMKLIGSNEKATQHYIDEEGKSRMLFEIVKKYVSPEKNSILGPGNPIDVYISWFSEEGRYLTEYLVDSRFFVEDLKKDCGLELVDSDNFGNQLNLHEEYLTKFAKFEETNETRKFLGDVAKFYENNSVNDGCKIWNSLFRYYVFRKVDNTKKIKQTGGNDSVNFNDTEKFIVPRMKEYKNKSYSFVNGIHHVLKNHHIIPHSVSPQDLFNELGLNIPKDDIIEKSNLGSFVKNINIEHVIDEQKQTTELINGLNVFIVERDCNDEYNVDLIKKSKKIKEDDLAIIMMREGTWYVPVYSVDQTTNDRVGLFKMTNPTIQQLMNDL